MKINHKFYSNLAFKIAENNLGKTKDNPSVGCVIEKNGTVISSGLLQLMEDRMQNITHLKEV